MGATASSSRWPAAAAAAAQLRAAVIRERELRLGEHRGEPRRVAGGAGQVGAVVVERGQDSRGPRGNHGATAASGASMMTSTSYFQPSLRCSSTASERVEVGGWVEALRRRRGRRRPGRRAARAGRRRCATSRAGTTARAGRRPPTGRAPSRGRGRRSPTYAGTRPARVDAARRPGSGWRSSRDRGRPPADVGGRCRGARCRPRPPTRSGSTRMILPSALPTASSVSVVACGPSTSAITRPRASGAVNISGGSRRPRPTR